jgi:hypothetical protein
MSALPSSPDLAGSRGMVDRPELSPGLLAQMAQQGGVFTAEQAAAHGHHIREIQRLRTRPPRPLISVRRGVYAWREEYEAAEPGPRHLLDIRAAYLRLTDNVVLSHQSAALVLGLELLDADLSLLHVTRQPPATPHVEAGIAHHVAELPAHQRVVRVGALDHTTLARTAVDVARDTSRMACAVAAFDSALRMGVPKAELREVFDRCRSWPGARLVARAIDMADGRADNPGESFSRVVLVQLGLAPDDLQVPVYDEEGLVGFADFGWQGVLGEFDGKGKYGVGDPSADPDRAVRKVWQEKRREDRLRVGHEVVRWGMAELYQPQRLRGRVLAAMARAVARGLRPA